MLDPLDRHSRDSTLFQFTTKRMRDFIDPKHLLIQIDEQFDFQKLVEPLEDYYCRDNGRPAIHNGAPVWCDASVREPLPAIVPTAGAYSGWRDREEEIRHARHSLRPFAVA